ncbi:predicted protein [Naegleria gruberi]|uniref:Predicted protein n=1 Tax=Naegleria gruberi TaxID=5762 RepID=D2VY63_NAEGR|nr:uncharacterized protein NAEGRDRAFT_81674 [Naegleria gruberi]EFC38309.1 predicted protein [Naegleria gruberi]|eukprot:XP_002671053.1 predicted protein [Naegleria gruberi strain NEG-M]
MQKPSEEEQKKALSVCPFHQQQQQEENSHVSELSAVGGESSQYCPHASSMMPVSNNINRESQNSNSDDHAASDNPSILCWKRSKIPKNYESLLKGIQERPPVNALPNANIIMDHRNTDQPQGDICYFFDSAINGNLEKMKELVEVKFFNVDTIDRFGYNCSALQFAVNGGKLEIVKYLISKNANVNLIDVSGETALHKACKKGNLEMVKLLLKAGIQKDYVNKLGKSPINILTEKGFTEISHYLSNFDYLFYLARRKSNSFLKSNLKHCTSKTTILTDCIIATFESPSLSSEHANSEPSSSNISTSSTHHSNSSNRPLHLVSFVLQKAQIGKKSIMNDVMYIVPFFFGVGFSMEVFMVKTGFYEYRKRKESETLTAKAAEFMLAKERIIEKFAEVKNGHIKRITDQDIQSSVLELIGTNVSTTYITCPASAKKTLGIKLPFLVMVIKNLKKYFTFEVQVLDDKNIKRRFRASNYQSTTRVKPFICTMPMRLDEGWNQIQFNLADFTRRAYGTNYIETLRVQIHANCRIRRIYFSDRLYSESDLPDEFRLFLPIQVSN